MPDEYGRILRLVNSRLSLPLVYGGCHKLLNARMPAPNMYVCIQEPGGLLRFPYYVDERFSEGPLGLFPKKGLTAYVIDTRHRYWITHDPQPPASYVPVGPLPEDWIGMPLFDRDGAVHGVLAVQTYKPGTRYDDHDIAFVEFAADALSLAIQLARQDRESAVHRIAALVEDTVDIVDLYGRIHEIIGDVIPASRRNIIISRVDENTGTFKPVYWRDEKDDFDSMHWPLEQGFSGFIYKISHKSFIFENEHSKIPPEVIPIGTPSTYWLGSPLFSHEKIIGIVVIQSYDESEVITKEDEYTLNSICPYIASAISHTELLTRLLKP
ncbi:MAG TPA: GAF domain-containing protein [bacterium]|nr:GAF domain-containing protein [bacterium]